MGLHEVPRIEREMIYEFGGSSAESIPFLYKKGVGCVSNVAKMNESWWKV